MSQIVSGASLVSGANSVLTARTRNPAESARVSSPSAVATTRTSHDRAATDAAQRASAEVIGIHLSPPQIRDFGVRAQSQNVSEVGSSATRTDGVGARSGENFGARAVYAAQQASAQSETSGFEAKG